MDDKTPWQVFSSTGSVADYIEYKKQEAHTDAADDDGAGNQSS